MNDLQMLHKAIGSLEEQASQISEFNGVLRAVNDARTEIEASKAYLSSLSTEHKQLVKDSYGKFEDVEKRLSDFEKKLVDLAKGQDRVQRTINELKILTPDQFEHGRDKILLKLTELNFLTPAQFEDGRRATNETLKHAISELAQNFEEANRTQQASLKSLKLMTVLGLLALTGVTTYLVFALLH
ncbi:hypothetical protein [Pseudomonas sp. Marseille-Q5115]|uniref:hypothetical protein n=1 Tax=Pseudomonas sp. Marseille-Q5115 TaxID=2866593 RepID=UPI001CE4ACC1|nr:hypothetical protein [Pseudomonas sp. Marseille-Q5115]